MKTRIGLVLLLFISAGASAQTPPQGYFFMPDIPTLAPGPNPHEWSDTYIMTLVEDESPGARSNPVFVRFLSETMGVCKVKESSPKRNFLCSDWLQGQTYLLLRILHPEHERLAVLEGSIVSIPPKPLIDDFAAAATEEGVQWPTEYRDHAPINPYYFHVDQLATSSHPGVFSGHAFQEVPSEQSSWLQVEFTPDLNSQDVQQQAYVHLKFTKYYRVKVRKDGKATVDIRGSSFTIEGPALRCPQPRCGMSEAGNIQSQEQAIPLEDPSQ
jgi:hypothetical protein